MTEMQILWETLIRSTAVIAYAFLYALGGRNYKIIRRAGAPLVFIAIMLYFTWNKWQALILPLLSLPLWFGYGRKDIRRIVYALISGSVGFVICAVYGNYWMAGFQFILTVSSTIFLGLINPVQAVKEEFLIACLSVSVLAYAI